jgi:hypothetical protein
VAGGLTPRQLRDELAEHGSPEAIAEAHPELADWLRDREEASRRVRSLAETIKAALPTLSLDEPPDLDVGLFRRQVVGELVALRRVHEASSAQAAQADVDVHPRSTPDPYPAAVFWKAVGMLLDGALLTEIADETGLSYNRVVKIRDWQAHPGELGPKGSPGYRLYPGETQATLVLKKLRKPR